ncbi:MAG: peroxiredoxin [Planctomycetes bacterium]|nr:peroxiredoxin [Planctomycetota bacterium]
MAAAAGCQPAVPPATIELAAAEQSPVVGATAPDFTLLDQNGQAVTLSGVRGKWVVLYFYPKDDTPGCTCQATEFTELLAHFRRMNAEVFGISEDSPMSHRRFVSRYNLALTLLSDQDHAVMERYGAWVQSGVGNRRYGRVVRMTMIVDPQGVIRYHWPEVIPQGHAARVREKLQELQQSTPQPPSGS